MPSLGGRWQGDVWGDPPGVFAFLLLEDGSVGTYHPRFEGRSSAIHSEMMRPILLTVTETLAVHYSRLDALMTTRDPGVPKKMFQDFFYRSFLVPRVVGPAARRNKEGDQTQSEGQQTKG